MILVDNRNNNNPYINAAIEEYIVRDMPPAAEDFVLVYINSPCVVAGKNQCIYKEVNFDFLRNSGIVIRRLSGGGAVYHDEGNLCISIVTKFADNKVNNYKYFHQPVIDILHRAGIDAVANERNDITWKGKKISGHAQFTDRKNIISHCTILVNTELGNLRAALKENPFPVEAKAVSSHRSHVMNISEESDAFKTANGLKAHLLRELEISAIRHFTDGEWTAINELALSKYKSDEWIWGRNPTTIITRNELTIVIENGKIKSITKNNGKIWEELYGCYYAYSNLQKIIGIHFDDNRQGILRDLF